MVFALLFRKEACKGHNVGVYFFGANRAFTIRTIGGHDGQSKRTLSLCCLSVERVQEFVEWFQSGQANLSKAVGRLE